MSTQADRDIHNHIARLLPLQEKADTPANSEGKQLHCCDYKSAEFAGAEIMTKIEGGESNRVQEGKPCGGKE